MLVYACFRLLQFGRRGDFCKRIFCGAGHGRATAWRGRATAWFGAARHGLERQGKATQGEARFTYLGAFLLLRL
jgi:hypothetical protein